MARSKYMKAKQRKIMKEQIEGNVNYLKWIAQDGDLTGAYEGYPKEEHVEVIATHIILLSIDSAIKFVEFNEQESYFLYKLKNKLQERFGVFDFIYGEKVEQRAELKKNKKGML